MIPCTVCLVAEKLEENAVFGSAFDCFKLVSDVKLQVHFDGMRLPLCKRLVDHLMVSVVYSCTFAQLPHLQASVQFLRKPHTSSRPFLQFIRLNSSHCFALYILESNHPPSDSAFNDTRSLPGELHEGFQKIPKKLPNPICPSLLSLRKIVETDAKSRIVRDTVWLGEGGPASLDSNERLRKYSGMLHGCALKGFLNEGKAIHGQVIMCGVDPDLHLWNSLVNFYAKCGSPEFARQVFNEMPKWDVVSWTALISGFVAKGYVSDGIDLFCEMRKVGFRPNEFTLAIALKACSMCLALDFGKQVHSEVVKVGAFSDIFVGSALVDIYAKCGEMDQADKVFFFMSKKNAISWNALLNGYAQMGDGKKVLNLFCQMTELEMKLSKFTLSTVLKGCANCGYLREAQVVHSLSIKIGCELDEFLVCCLLDMYSKWGLADDALKVFKRIKDPNIVAWSAMINCLDQQGQSQEATQLFCLMRHTGMRPNEFTLACLVSAAINMGDQHYGKSIHACACKWGFESENFVSNALVAMYMKFGLIQNGWRVFEAMMIRDSVSWNALLSGFHNNETCDQGPRIFKHMLMEGFKPDMHTFVSILGCCSSLSNVGFGKQVHAHIVKIGLDGNGSVGTALIDMYAKSGCLEDADVIFNRLIERDLFTWTVIIASYAHTGQGEKAVKCFNQMQQEGVKPNEFTLSSCLSGCSSLATIDNGRQIHSLAIKTGLSGDTYVASSLVDMYGKCRYIEDAEAVFKGMDSPNTVSWNAIICGYSQHGQGQKALEAFRIMLNKGTMPDEVTFIGVLSAFSHMGLIEEGKMHFNSLSKVYGITPTIEHYACMVNLLSWAGKFSEVESFVEEMKLSQNALIWETVLWACKMHGNVEYGQRAAKKLFELEPGMDYNYILLSDIFAANGRWDDVAKVRALMSDQGIKKEPGCSWLEVNAQAHVFHAQDNSHPNIKEIHLQLEELTR
ncbi:hypothetical protein L1049_022440 [Liquidambar formosana]|uniref:Pentatricopeptide repeat-containing protein n=1 Tax=Liquidambar formosana TaxID=63359 RepID=A0AAP0RCF0_LIQFO